MNLSIRRQQSRLLAAFALTVPRSGSGLNVETALRHHPRPKIVVEQHRHAPVSMGSDADNSSVTRRAVGYQLRLVQTRDSGRRERAIRPLVVATVVGDATEPVAFRWLRAVNWRVDDDDDDRKQTATAFARQSDASSDT